LEALAAKILPGSASKKTETRYVAISRKIEGKDHEITLDNTATSAVICWKAASANSPKSSILRADPVHHEYQQGRTVKLALITTPIKSGIRKLNYMQGTFT